MFRHGFKAPLFILFALLIHLFSAHQNSTTAVVLCLGDDGHIALEVAQHQPHHAQISDRVEHPSRCAESENCQDILLAFGHQEMLAVPKFRAELLLPSLDPVRAATLVYALREFQDLAETSLPPLSLAALPQADLTHHRAFSAQTQTLKHTILTI